MNVMKKVLIVKEGHWGSVEPEVYQMQVDIYRKILEEAKDSLGNKAKVTIVETAKEAEEIVRMEEVDKVVFISRGMKEAAERMVKAFPRIKVIIFTGYLPNKGERSEKILWVDKFAFTDLSEITDLILS